MWPRCWMSIVSFFQEYDACYVDLRRSVATDAFFLTTKEMFDRCRQVILAVFDPCLQFKKTT